MQIQQLNKGIQEENHVPSEEYEPIKKKTLPRSNQKLS